MKNNVLLIIFFLTLFGCQKESRNHIYSCDEKVNSWTIENKSEIKRMNRHDILEYSIEYQKAIYRAFTPNQRLSCWKEKLNEVLGLRWNNDDRQHILALLDKLNENWFIEYYNERNPNILSMDDFMKNWIDQGINQLGWSKALVHSMIVCLETNVSDNGYLVESDQILNYENTLKDSGEGTCLCSNASDWCNLGGNELGYCKENADNCKHSTLGCGALWTYPCDGKCRLGLHRDE